MKKTRGPRKRKSYRVSPGVAYREVEGRSLLLCPDHSTVLSLNAIGQLIWRRLARGRTLDEITRALVRELEVPVDVARQDVETFVRDLEQRKLVVKA